MSLNDFFFYHKVGRNNLKTCPKKCEAPIAPPPRRMKARLMNQCFIAKLVAKATNQGKQRKR